jgi:uncharacterized phage protein (TIGR01671 family)
MIEIKFRAKNLKGEWEYGYYLEFELCDGEGRCSYIKKDGCQPIKVLKETVGQFTGLLDKNQSEVYDGDIIKAPSGRIYLVMWSTWIHQERRDKWTVDEYQFTGWCIGYERNKPIDTLDSEVLQGEVIGNVHDNPELINE